MVDRFSPEAASDEPQCFIVAVRENKNSDFAVYRRIAREHIDDVLGERGEAMVASEGPVTSKMGERALEYLSPHKIDVRDFEKAQQRMRKEIIRALNEAHGEGW